MEGKVSIIRRTCQVPVFLDTVVTGWIDLSTVHNLTGEYNSSERIHHYAPINIQTKTSPRDERQSGAPVPAGAGHAHRCEDAQGITWLQTKPYLGMGGRKRA